jgi:hypothetical protein
MSSDLFREIGVPWPLIVDFSMLAMNFSGMWYVISTMNKNYISRDTFSVLKDSATDSFSSELHTLRKRMDELHEDNKTQRERVNDLLVAAAKKGCL